MQLRSRSWSNLAQNGVQLRCPSCPGKPEAICNSSAPITYTPTKKQRKRRTYVKHVFAAQNIWPSHAERMAKQRDVWQSHAKHMSNMSLPRETYVKATRECFGRKCRGNDENMSNMSLPRKTYGKATRNVWQSHATYGKATRNICQLFVVNAHPHLASPH